MTGLEAKIAVASDARSGGREPAAVAAGTSLPGKLLIRLEPHAIGRARRAACGREAP